MTATEARDHLLTRTPSFKNLAYSKLSLRYSFDVVLLNLDWSDYYPTAVNLAYTRYTTAHTDPLSGVVYNWHPFALSAKANPEDYPSFKDVLNMPEDEQSLWFESMRDEWRSLAEKQCFEIVDIKPVLEAGHEIVPTTWALRMKRKPDGRPYKRKSRLCLRGDLESTINSRSEVYAPLVDWTTVRTMFALSLSEGWITSQVDFKLAFIHADQPTEKYAEFPPGGWKKYNPGKCLRLRKSLYGQRTAPQMWYRWLKSGLEARGWIASARDSCLYHHPTKDITFTVYCDDGIFYAKDAKDIQDSIR